MTEEYKNGEYYWVTVDDRRMIVVYIGEQKFQSLAHDTIYNASECRNIEADE